MYGKRGVCRVEDIGEFFKESMGDGREYYKLVANFCKGRSGVYSRGKSCVYAGGHQFRDCKEISGRGIGDSGRYIYLQTADPVGRSYKEMMDTYDINVLLSLIKGIYVKQYQASRRNKKLCQIDQRYLKSAEILLMENFAIALESTPEKIKDFVKDQVICQMQG